MTPVQAQPDYPHWPAVAALIHRAFAYMEPRLGHPARAMALDAAALSRRAGEGAAFVIEAEGTPIACLFTRHSRDLPGALYIGTLAVAESHRGQGLARHLIATAEEEARQHGFRALTLDTGRPLTELLALFTRLGFETLPGSGETVTMRKVLGETPREAR
ncbi:MAG: GNAT family N-acetyltransferase [Pseudomonadota bacterium]